MLVLQPLMLLLLPLTLGLWLRRRWRLTWTIFGHGALAFGLSKLVQLPTQWLVVAQLPAGAQLPVALAFAPLCEESARYLVLRRIATTNDDWRRGVFFGLGHGGVEAMLLGALVAATLLGAAAGRTSAAA